MELNDYRKKLDEIDEQIVALFCQRMQTVQQIAEYKKDHDLPILAPGREKEILDRVHALSGEELAPYAATLFDTLMYVSREYQKTLM